MGPGGTQKSAKKYHVLFLFFFSFSCAARIDVGCQAIQRGLVVTIAILSVNPATELVLQTPLFKIINAKAMEQKIFSANFSSLS